MMDLRPVLFVIGILLSILAVAMVIPAVFDFAAGHADWQVFALAAAVTLFVGVALTLTTRVGRARFSLRQAFVMTNLAWLVTAVFGALPFAFSGLEMSPTDAFFESMSGVTTTGATVITGLDLAPPGILLWRAILQWLGGIGIIVMAVAVMPILQVGGMQLSSWRSRSCRSSRSAACSSSGSRPSTPTRCCPGPPRSPAGSPSSMSS
jgi:trk system potassium uptake protein TrkH